jgi:hypothetical protein
MALNTYATIKTAVRSWTKSDTNVLTDTILDEITEAVEDIIWAKLRVSEMRSTHTYPYAAGGTDLSAFDTGLLLNIIAVTVDLTSTNTRIIPPASEGWIRQNMVTSITDDPLGFGWLSESDGTAKLVIAPEPGTLQVDVSYFRKFASLTTATNAVFLAYPMVWLAGILAEAFLFLQDMEAFTVWDTRFIQRIGLANEGSRGLNEALQGQGLAARLPTTVP